MPCTGAELFQEWDFPAPSGDADSACHGVLSQPGQDKGTTLGWASVLGLVEVVAVLLPPAPLSAFCLVFLWCLHLK